MAVDIEAIESLNFHFYRLAKLSNYELSKRLWRTFTEHVRMSYHAWLRMWTLPRDWFNKLSKALPCLPDFELIKWTWTESPKNLFKNIKSSSRASSKTSPPSARSMLVKLQISFDSEHQLFALFKDMLMVPKDGSQRNVKRSKKQDSSPLTLFESLSKAHHVTLIFDEQDPHVRNIHFTFIIL